MFVVDCSFCFGSGVVPVVVREPFSFDIDFDGPVPTNEDLVKCTCCGGSGAVRLNYEDARDQMLKECRSFEYVDRV